MLSPFKSVLAALALCLPVTSIAAPQYAEQATGTEQPAAAKSDKRYESAPPKPTPLTGLGGRKPQQQAAPEFDVTQLDELIALQLPALALSIIDSHQGSVDRFTPVWYRMERKRISVLALLERWDDIIGRIDAALSDNPDIDLLPRELIDWFLTQQAMAFLNSGEHDTALRWLGRLIWADAHYDREVIFALWRRLVINAYLQQDNIADAEKAMLRYDYDYRDSEFALTEDWKFTRAGVLLRLGRYDEVIERMQAKSTSMETQYHMLASLRLDNGNAWSILEEIIGITRGKLLSKSDRWAYRYIVYEARSVLDNENKQMAALQDLLSVGKTTHPLQDIVDAGPDDWWRHYIDAGVALGNRLRLLRGDDSGWYGKAIEMREQDADKAIALLAALAAHSRDLHHRQVAHAELIDILSRRKNSMDLLLQLYAYSDFIDDLEVIPVSSRAELIDHALDKKDITQAARLMQSLEDVPADEDPFVWRLRKARVLVLEGEYADGETVLFRLFDKLPQLDTDKLDRIMQVLFDLQSVQRHEAALALFRRIGALPLSFDLRRELYFWMAQSYQSLSRYAEAAMHYLRSARTEDGGMNDQWALSSRLKAAEALVKAGLYDDAETLYGRLLESTGNESRKAMIEQELQHIYLLRNASDTRAKPSAR